MTFSTGELSPELLEAVLNTIPMELTVCDADDIVRYYTGRDDLIFARDESMLGTDVRVHHSKASLDTVNRILADFKAGSRDEFAFWHPDNAGRFILTRYLAVRAPDGRYLGCVEAVQDIASHRTLTDTGDTMITDSGKTA